MKLTSFIKDQGLSIIFYLFSVILILLMLLAFKVPTSLVIAILIALLFLGISLLIIDFYRKKKFYDDLRLNIERLDKKYLVLETLVRPSFYEGEIFYDSLYEIDKAMNEFIKDYELQIMDFKEYIEMWIHEVKIPIASLTLLNHNYNNLPKEFETQIKKLDNYIDQVLYYVRSENFEKDFVITEVSLSNIIKNVNLKNKDDLLESKIDLEVKDIDTIVLTDSKWLEFIINQIINNCIKYRKDGISSYIKIYGDYSEDKFVLNIYDNGIGIPKKDLSQVFKKSFTGENGRGRVKSTGMGLYIAKKLCIKLGHIIEIESIVNSYTNVSITFAKNNFYKMDD